MFAFLQKFYSPGIVPVDIVSNHCEVVLDLFLLAIQGAGAFFLDLCFGNVDILLHQFGPFLYLVCDLGHLKVFPKVLGVFFLDLRVDASSADVPHIIIIIEYYFISDWLFHICK